MKHSAFLKILWIVFTGITCYLLSTANASTAIWSFVLSIFCLLKAEILELKGE